MAETPALQLSQNASVADACKAAWKAMPDAKLSAEQRASIASQAQTALGNHIAKDSSFAYGTAIAPFASLSHLAGSLHTG